MGLRILVAQSRPGLCNSTEPLWNHTSPCVFQGSMNFSYGVSDLEIQRVHQMAVRLLPRGHRAGSVREWPPGGHTGTTGFTSLLVA